MTARKPIARPHAVTATAVLALMLVLAPLAGAQAPADIQKGQPQVLASEALVDPVARVGARPDQA